MVSFDPVERTTVHEALSHPWLATYHDETDEPECPRRFERWRDIEKLETLEDFREVIWNEIQDFRMEVRGLKKGASLPRAAESSSFMAFPTGSAANPVQETAESALLDPGPLPQVSSPERIREATEMVTATEISCHGDAFTPTDPLVNYARRPSIRQPAYNSPSGQLQSPWQANTEGHATNNGVPFPGQSYVVPARSRAPSTAGDGARKLLRTLSTVSIHESVDRLPGGLAAVAPIGKFIVGQESGADAPPSEIPKDFDVGGHGNGEGC